MRLQFQIEEGRKLKSFLHKPQYQFYMLKCSWLFGCFYVSLCFVCLFVCFLWVSLGYTLSRDRLFIRDWGGNIFGPILQDSLDQCPMSINSSQCRSMPDQAELIWYWLALRNWSALVSISDQCHDFDRYWSALGIDRGSLDFKVQPNAKTVLFFNFRAEADMDKREAKCVVKNDGYVFWLVHNVHKSACLFDTSNYPFDQHTCHMWFQSMEVRVTPFPFLT